jgi:signal transduction histidine kinase
MVAKHSRHIALTGLLADYVAGEVMKGEYASASDMVRTALRLLMDHKGPRHSSDTDSSLALEGDLSIRTILETSHQNQGLLTPEGKIIYVNATALASINGRLEDVVGRDFWETPWFTGTPGMPEKVREAVALVAAGETAKVSMPLNMPTGNRIYEFSMRPVMDSGGKVIALVPEAVEITARIHAEEALRQAQKMEAIGQLTGGVAHDFNNLLTVIKSSSDLLKRPGLSEERRNRFVEAISLTVDRAAKLTGQLLAFARRQALQPKVFDVGMSIQSLAEMVHTITGSRIAVTTHLPEERCFINADPSQFDTAFINMAVNARDAMNGEGQLSITVDSVEGVPPIRAHAAKAAPYVAVSITDTGMGIPAQDLDRIFEPFFTTKGVGEGTGLGLSQVFGFVKQSNGEVAVMSEVGRGTTFTLYLPSVGAPEEIEAVEEEASPKDGGGTCVMVVEDNREIGAFLTQTLDELGYHSHWVENAQDALAALASAPKTYDIVFSDVVMPGKINGVELGREIRRLYPNLPVVLASGYSKVLAGGDWRGFQLLQKPYSVEQLSRVLLQALAR